MKIKKMRSRAICFALVCFGNIAFAQNYFTVEASQVFSTFKFIDSDGKQDNNYSNVISTASGLGFRMITDKSILFRGNVGLRKAGAALLIDQNSYSWTLNYVDFKIGIGYMLRKWRLKPYIIGSPYYAYLLKASQSINALNYDIKKNAFKSSDFGAIGTVGCMYDLNPNFSIITEFNYIMGLQNNEIDGKQKSFNRAYSFSLGIAIKTSKKSPKWLQ